MAFLRLFLVHSGATLRLVRLLCGRRGLSLHTLAISNMASVPRTVAATWWLGEIVVATCRRNTRKEARNHVNNQSAHCSIVESVFVVFFLCSLCCEECEESNRCGVAGE